MLPPPPPPAPPLFPLAQSNQRSAISNPPADRNALLSQIKKGAHLKRTETNDRSAPSVGSSAKSSAGGSSNSKCNGPLIPAGGLFAHGMPKLRPTTPSPAGGNNNHHLQQNSSSLTGSENRSHPPSPVLRQPDTARNFPSDINLKGPAPAPPFAGDPAARSRTAAAVRRSASQTNLKVRPLRPPPNIRPPPPPKSTSALQGGARPPAPPELLPNAVRRRQSFGVAEGRVNASLSSDVARGFHNKSAVPPPPPRNFNQMPNGSPGPVHVNKMNIAPPPPPCRPPGIRAPPSVRPPPPPVRSPAPPPPPHRLQHPAPPSQMKMGGSAPPPPLRISSVGNNSQTNTSDFESRFVNKFQNVQYFPAPERFSRCVKTYPSKINQEKGARRQPPPPPPLPGLNGPRCYPGGSQPVLHIQLESRVFANNSAHC